MTRPGGTRVLVVDDDDDIRDMLESTLGYAGYAVRAAADAAAALAALTEERPDVVVLDVGMPVLDGYGLVRLLRDRGENVPVLFLSARDAVEDRVQGLRSGGDDYLVKPFSVVEVSARIDALVRRSESSGPEGDTVVQVGDVLLDTARHVVTRAGHPIDLSPTEFRLLHLLFVNAGQVVTKTQILDRIWGYDFGGDTNVIERFISNLRRKLEQPGAPGLLHTVRGFGYKAEAGEL